MQTESVLTQFDTLHNDAVLFQAITAALCPCFPRTSRFGRSVTPVIPWKPV